VIRRLASGRSPESGNGGRAGSVCVRLASLGAPGAAFVSVFRKMKQIVINNRKNMFSTLAVPGRRFPFCLLFAAEGGHGFFPCIKEGSECCLTGLGNFWPKTAPGGFPPAPHAAVFPLGSACPSARHQLSRCCGYSRRPVVRSHARLSPRHAARPLTCSTKPPDLPRPPENLRNSPETLLLLHNEAITRCFPGLDSHVSFWLGQGYAGPLL
jgi:hypothetical protein